MLSTRLILFALPWPNLLFSAVAMSYIKKSEMGLQTLERRVNCNGRGNFVVYEAQNSDGGYHMICLNGFIVAGCSLLVAGGSQVITELQNRVVNWVFGKDKDASDAGPQARFPSVHPMTWGQLYFNRTNAGTGIYQPVNETDAIIALTLHDDGFSASISLLHAGLIEGGKNDVVDSSCREQIHIHYWAASGHESTLLSSSEIGSLVVHGLNDAVSRNRGQACYEMTNNGNWDGWLRVCFNNNVPQPGCYTCGGHNN
ncbi:hypothetical protein O1611_g1550 [Lasiodiplodia mahajangana]|uniref:Uncharacterized protein n=1 Tax=Lasiodiplodia mahajangana TaxID=1108764 RepID=A0ACC2JXA7_9PEZI|nr:hypothetical protein O1611_g1550 [Lasiodiplodia mahajangana]